MTDPGSPQGRPQQRKQVLLRLDPLVYEALARWAGDELRSANAQIEFLLRRALAESGRLPGGTGPIPRRGRPPRAAAQDAAQATAQDAGREPAPDSGEAEEPRTES
ncbi:hypothetical protein [Streptomyces sp. NPDC051219]|uniref:hypothetical protein n=1 Tax=Streptomyces sp. NPDC051219 TaxID=3155283 RepID=UPI003415E367